MRGLCARLVGLILAGALAASGQIFSQRGFLETSTSLYPETVPVDRGHAVSEWLLRYEPTFRPAPGLTFNAGFDAQIDSHRQVARESQVRYWDRTLQRPALAVRELKATWVWKHLTAEVGKQFIRWGKTDILAPTDRFSPRDYMAVVVNEYLAVSGIRLTVGGDSDSLEVVYTPRFTPSRIPLSNQRWAALPQELSGFQLRDFGARYPRGGQAGARWNHMGRLAEFSLSYFQGYNPLPLFDGAETSPGTIDFQRFYAPIRTYGADTAIPLPWFTLKGEAAWFQSRDRKSDEYFLYVIQAERQVGEWLFLGGYIGEELTRSSGNPLSFAPDRGIAKSFAGRISYTIDANSSLVFETVVKENGDGFLGKLEYSRGLGQHWRITLRGVEIQGDQSDFIGRYRHNSLVALVLRYSF